MLPAIAAHAIRRYTRPGDLVLDPMCGIGTTLVEAIRLSRDAIGTEYERRWADLARANLHHAIDAMRHGRGDVVHGDARHLDTLLAPHHRGEVALVVTSPPYGDSAHGHVRSTSETGTPGVTKRNAHYSRDPRNLAHASTDQLLVAFAHILRQATLFLRPGGTAVVTARPWRTRGELIDLPTAVLAAGRHAGLLPVERCAALLAGIRDDHLVLRPSFFQMKNTRDARRRGLPLHLIAHEDVLIFRKPGTDTRTRRSCSQPRRSAPARICVHGCPVSQGSPHPCPAAPELG
ncbi:TRM11 family SAM-dependent methyltransferase [Streptomyces radicis]|uniref:Methyltransferase n=1 Tax=Streptomyces radicis TaxID=1750517 RepID=A0A3A9WGZ7_9ACTN|nr:DNA methyltransferase [Streptomyces radicis]RKN11583.1 site-specific DNA-methyltransferase [Streptomyces radicis]RKN26398.1 site-specific DNA-methyltransferase [Streptomyces radicis]